MIDFFGDLSVSFILNYSKFRIVAASDTLLYKLHNAVNTDGLSTSVINEDIRGMHVFQSNAVRDIVYPLPRPIITESFRKN